jgi:pyridoxamine---pyruvate transaminase
MTQWPMLNLTAGPVEGSPRTLREMARPVLHFDDPVFVETYDRTTRLLQEVFRTRHDVVIMHGEAMLGLEAAAASLISPGDKVLNLVSGVFGKWYELFIERHGGGVVELAVPYDEAIDPEDVRRTLRANPEIRFLSVVHSETPSGTVNPLEEICRIAREHEVLTIVDTVSGLGGEPLLVDDWGVDVACAGPQKFLAGPPGLSLLAVSPAAWRAMEANGPPLTNSYLSILDWKTTWLTKKGTYPYTPSTSDIYALDSALTQLLEIGLERFQARADAIARACRAGIRALGLNPWPARDEVAGRCVTAVARPEGIEITTLLSRLRDHYGVMLSGGVGDLDGRLFRIGHMGPVAHPTFLTAGLGALERALADLGYPVSFGAGVGAALEALAGWSDADGS